MWEGGGNIMGKNVRSHDRENDNGRRRLKVGKNGRSLFEVILSEFNKSFLWLRRRNTIGAFWGCWSNSCFLGCFLASFFPIIGEKYGMLTI